jgi:uncharacterized protein YqiB (DUF1249 family)
VPGIATPWLRGPTVGALLELLEENYQLLLCLAPDLRRLAGGHRASGQGTDLYLDVIDQARYTTTLRLTYRFPSQDDSLSQNHFGCQNDPLNDETDQTQSWHADPDAYLRVCHDARQVEVISLRQTVLPLFGEDRLATLQSKWDANWFLAKWLGYCVREDYRFFPARPRPRTAKTLDSAPAC